MNLARTSVATGVASALAVFFVAGGATGQCGGVRGFERIVVSAALEIGDEYDIYLMLPDGSDMRCLTPRLDRDAIWPRISPDGKHIAFSAPDDEGYWQTWVMTANGSEIRMLTAWPEAFGSNVLDWLDNERVMYRRTTGRSTGDIHVVDVNTLGDELLVPASAVGQGSIDGARISCDGQTIALIAQRGSAGQTEDVYLVASDGSNPRCFYEDALDEYVELHPVWHSDGTVFWPHNMQPGVTLRDYAVVYKHMDSMLWDSMLCEDWDGIFRPSEDTWVLAHALSPREDAMLLEIREVEQLVVVEVTYSPGAGYTSGNEVVILDVAEIEGADWGELCSPPARGSDTNDDGVVDVLDLLNVLSDWGRCD